jgi:hypothetical protein
MNTSLIRNVVSIFIAPRQNSFRCAKSGVRKKEIEIGLIKYFICSKSTNPLDLSQKNPRAKCQYFTEALAAS